MENKEIIIDGIDVSKCEYLIEDYQRANNLEDRYEHIKNVCELGERGIEYHNIFCKDNSNCYYKQLKCKEQECEELKKQLERKEENYQKLLSKSNKYIHNLIDEHVQDISNLGRQLDQLKKTLADIEFWVRKFLKRTGQVVPNEIRQILQKISESEVDNAR